jgi:hypothetical protein
VRAAPGTDKEVSMAGINGKRVVAGGVVAGIVLLALEVVAETAFALDWEGWLASLGVGAPGPAVEAYYLGAGLLMGVLGVWLYAAMRPRLGAGPRTAIVVALVLWALNCLIPTAALAAFGLLPVTRLFWVPVLFPLVQLPLAMMAGAWVYREPAPEGSRVGSLATEG